MPERGKCFRARKVLWHGISNFVWVSGSEGGKVGGSHKKFSGRERRAKGRVRLLWARGSAELGKVAFQVSGVKRSRLPGRGTVRKIRRASDRAKKKVYRFRVRFG